MTRTNDIVRLALSDRLTVLGLVLTLLAGMGWQYLANRDQLLLQGQEIAGLNDSVKKLEDQVDKLSGRIWSLEVTGTPSTAGRGGNKP